jgi:hypothetical protein
VTPQPKLTSGKLLDLQGSMGPPSGLQNININQQNNESFAQYQNLVGQGENNQSSFKESFKNPWTTIPRPMNRFAEISEVQYERQEKEKQDLQRVLQDQIDEKKRRHEDEKRKQIEEEQRFEAKLKRDREELLQRER